MPWPLPNARAMRIVRPLVGDRGDSCCKTRTSPRGSPHTAADRRTPQRMADRHREGGSMARIGHRHRRPGGARRRLPGCPPPVAPRDHAGSGTRRVGNPEHHRAAPRREVTSAGLVVHRPSCRASVPVPPGDHGHRLLRHARSHPGRRPAPRIRALLRTVAAAVTALAGASQVYLGANWLTDILGGWALGALWIAIILTVELRLSRPRRRSARARQPKTRPRPTGRQQAQPSTAAELPDANAMHSPTRGSVVFL